MGKIIIEKCLKGYNLKLEELTCNGGFEKDTKIKGFDYRCKGRECNQLENCEYKFCFRSK